MPRAYSQDLRERVIGAVEAGASCREAAAVFDCCGAGSDAGGNPRQVAAARYRGQRQYGVAVLRSARHQLQKKACARRSKIAKTSASRGPAGNNGSRGLIRQDWSSSMRPAPQPTWQGCAGAARAESGSSLKCRRATGRRPPSSPPSATTGSPLHSWSTPRWMVRSSSSISNNAWPRRSRLARSSLWTIFLPTRSPACARESRQPAQCCSAYPPILPISIRSSSPSQNSKLTCASPPSAPSPPSGIESEQPSRPSLQKSATTTSHTPDMGQNEGNPLGTTFGTYKKY